MKYETKIRLVLWPGVLGGLCLAACGVIVELHAYEIAATILARIGIAGGWPLLGAETALVFVGLVMLLVGLRICRDMMNDLREKLG